MGFESLGMKGCTKIEGTVLGAPIVSIKYSILVSILGSVIYGNYHLGLRHRAWESGVEDSRT